MFHLAVKEPCFILVIYYFTILREKIQQAKIIRLRYSKISAVCRNSLAVVYIAFGTENHDRFFMSVFFVGSRLSWSFDT